MTEGIERWDSLLFTEAFLVWIGWGRNYPQSDDASVVSRFGADVASKLLPAFRWMRKEFYSTDAYHVAKDLPEMEEMATKEFKAKHPEVPDEVVNALGWSYIFSAMH